MLKTIETLLAELDYSILDRIHEPPRSPSLRPLPPSWRDHRVVRLAEAFAAGSDRLWSHQAEALERLARGENVLLSTATASGKSLVFLMAALRTVLDDERSRVLALYPAKALVQDQELKWRKALETLELPASHLARLDGGVPVETREASLEDARIVIATPDIVHHWLMRHAGGSTVRRFLAHLDLVVLDEAHMYDALFGTNAAFLFRRLRCARELLGGRRGTEMRFIAASATMAEAAGHMEALVGRPFAVLDESRNGAPHRGRDILHVRFTPRSRSGYRDLQRLIRHLLDRLSDRRLLVFVDSRQGVERTVREIGTDVLPYRAGLEEVDRREIMEALRANHLRGVVSTSALELGIDIPALEIGLNLGVPWSRRSFRQRIGRIGRSSYGVFLVLASEDQFTRMGTTFRKYYADPPEPCRIYIHNRFVQYAHARCLNLEIEGVGSKASPLGFFPKDFERIYQYALPGAGRPKEFDMVHNLGGDDPHLNYGLRTNIEPGLEIRDYQTGESRGSVDLRQAIREAYPGGVYLYLGHSYRVERWHSGVLRGEIRVRRTKYIETNPIIEVYTNIDMTEGRSGIMNDHTLTGEHGFMAETKMHIVERVVGFKVGNQKNMYKDMRDRPGYNVKTRDLRTTGVVMHFSKEYAGMVRDMVSALREIVPQVFGIAPVDFEVRDSRIAVQRLGGRRPLRPAVVIYDTTMGGLRLTEVVHSRFPELLEALDLAGHAWASALERWYRSLAPGLPPALVNGTNVPPNEGWFRVLAPGSRAFYRAGNGLLQEIVIRGPCLINLPDYGIENEAGYEIETDQGLRRVVERAVEPGEDGGTWVDWNPTTGEIRPLDGEA